MEGRLQGQRDDIKGRKMNGIEMHDVKDTINKKSLEKQNFFLELFILCIWVFTWMYVCTPHAYLVSVEPRRRRHILWNWNYRQFWVTLRVLGVESHPLQEQWVLLTAEPSSAPTIFKLRNRPGALVIPLPLNSDCVWWLTSVHTKYIFIIWSSKMSLKFSLLEIHLHRHVLNKPLRNGDTFVLLLCRANHLGMLFPCLSSQLEFNGGYIRGLLGSRVGRQV